jgi:hypothetical protein
MILVSKEKSAGAAMSSKSFFVSLRVVEKPLFPVLTPENQVVEDEKLDMVFCITIHDERALTRFILSNLGRGLKSTLFPERSIKMA